MPSAWVLDASPLIVLARIGQLRLFTDQVSELWVPPAVSHEIRSGPAADPAREALEAGWGKVVAPPDGDLAVLEWSLGPGETEVISVARRAAGATAVLDDAVARHCARALRVPLIGTLGVVVRAKMRGMLASAAEVVQALRSEGMYLDDELVDKVLQQVGER